MVVVRPEYVGFELDLSKNTFLRDDDQLVLITKRPTPARVRRLHCGYETYRKALAQTSSKTWEDAKWRILWT